jgi:hypothetical protein
MLHKNSSLLMHWLLKFIMLTLLIFYDLWQLYINWEEEVVNRFDCYINRFLIWLVKFKNLLRVIKDFYLSIFMLHHIFFILLEFMIGYFYISLNFISHLYLVRSVNLIICMLFIPEIYYIFLSIVVIREDRAWFGNHLGYFY